MAVQMSVALVTTIISALVPIDHPLRQNRVEPKVGTLGSEFKLTHAEQTAAA